MNHGAPALASGRGLALASPYRWSCGRLPYGDRPYPLVAHDDGPATALAQSTHCQEIRNRGARARGRGPARLSGPLWPQGCVPRSDTGAHSGRRLILSLASHWLTENRRAKVCPLGDARHVSRSHGEMNAIWSILKLAMRCSNGSAEHPEDPGMRLAVQIALDVVLAWLICLSIAVAVLATIRIQSRDITNLLR